MKHLNHLFIALALPSIALLSSCSKSDEPMLPMADIIAGIISVSTLSVPVLDKSSSLEGVDTTGSGIRDDINNFISSHFIHPHEISAARQYARVIQQVITPDAEKASSLTRLKQDLLLSQACNEMLFPATSERRQHIAQIFGMTLNTVIRRHAFDVFFYTSANVPKPDLSSPCK